MTYDESDQVSFIDILIHAGVIDKTSEEVLQSYSFGFINLGFRELYEIDIRDVPEGWDIEKVRQRMDEMGVFQNNTIAESHKKTDKQFQEILEKVKKDGKPSTSIKPSID